MKLRKLKAWHSQQMCQPFNPFRRYRSFSKKQIATMLTGEIGVIYGMQVIVDAAL